MGLGMSVVGGKADEIRGKATRCDFGGRYHPERCYEAEGGEAVLSDVDNPEALTALKSAG